MSDSSELLRFLERQQAIGETDSEGTFTIARDRALEKLAEYSLPSDSDWGLKVLQNLTRCPEASTVSVSQDRGAVLFEMPGVDWDLAELEASFYRPDLPNEHPLRDLLTGLWDVGIRQERQFRLTLPQTDECLHWNGKELSREPASTPTRVPRLAVSQASIVETSWLHRTFRSKAYERQSQFARKLRSGTTVYPLTLTLNGEPVTGLTWRIQEELPHFHQLLEVHCVEAELPTLALPRHALQDPPTWRDRIPKQRPSLETLSYRRFAERHFPERVPVLGTFTANYLEHDESFTLRAYKLAPEHSHLCWVRRGVVTHREPLTLYPSPGSFDIFLNADDLATDLTSLRLVSSEAKQERSRIAFSAMAAHLKRKPKLILKEFYEKPRRRGRGAGLGLAVLSTVSLTLGWGVEYLGYPIAAAVALSAGARKRKDALRLELAHASAIDLFAPNASYSNAGSGSRTR